jgi:hypothetical protein
VSAIGPDAPAASLPLCDEDCLLDPLQLDRKRAQFALAEKQRARHRFFFPIVFSVDGQTTAWATITSFPLNVADGDP